MRLWCVTGALTRRRRGALQIKGWKLNRSKPARVAEAPKLLSQDCRHLAELRQRPRLATYELGERRRPLPARRSRALSSARSFSCSRCGSRRASSGPAGSQPPAPPLEPELELGVATPTKSGAVKASNEMRQSHRSGRSARRRCQDFLREVVNTLEPRDERAVEALIVPSAGTSRRQLRPAGISITRSDPMPHTHERRTGLLRPAPRRKGHQRRLRSG